MATKDPNQPNAPGEYYLLKTNSKGDLGNVDTDNSVKEFFEDRDIGVIQSTALLQSLNTVEFKSPTTTPNTLYVDGDAGTGWPGLKAGTLNIPTSSPINNLTVNWSVDSSDLHQTEKNFAAAILREGVDKNGNVVTDWKTSLYFAHPTKKFIKIFWIQLLPQELKNLLGGCVQDIITSSTVQGFFEDIENGITSYVELSSGGKDTTLSDKNAENIIDIENKIKYNESIIRHLFISVKEHDGEDSQLLIDSRNKKSESEDEESNVKNEVKEKPADDDEKKNEEEIVSKEESIEDISSDSIEEDSKDE